MSDPKEENAQGGVPGTGEGDQGTNGTDEGSQETLVIATPTGTVDDITSVNPAVPKETEGKPPADTPAMEEKKEGSTNGMPAMETPTKPEMAATESDPDQSTTESTPFYNDVSTGVEEKVGMIYPVEYPKGHPEHQAPATGSQQNIPSLAGPGKKGGSPAKPGRNSGANAAESKEDGPDVGKGPEGKGKGKGKSKSKDDSTKKSGTPGRNSGAGAAEAKEGPGAGPNAGPGKKNGAGPAGGAGPATGGAKGVKPGKTGQSGGEKKKKDEEKGKQLTVGGGQTSTEGVSRLPACAVKGNLPTIEPKSVDNWSGLILGGDRCKSDCECASGCCGWFWVMMCVDPGMQVRIDLLIFCVFRLPSLFRDDWRLVASAWHI